MESIPQAENPAHKLKMQTCFALNQALGVDHPPGNAGPNSRPLSQEAEPRRPCASRNPTVQPSQFLALITLPRIF